jgi:hypothetical protein
MIFVLVLSRIQSFIIIHHHSSKLFNIPPLSPWKPSVKHHCHPSFPHVFSVLAPALAQDAALGLPRALAPQHLAELRRQENLLPGSLRSYLLEVLGRPRRGKIMGKWWFLCRWIRFSWWENVETCWHMLKPVEKTWGLKIELKIVKDEIRMLPWFSHESTWFSHWIYGILRIPSGNLAVCYGQWRVCRWFSYWILLFYGFSIAMLLCSLELRIHSTESGWYMIYDDIYTGGWYVTHINAISNRLIHLAIWGYFAVFRVERSSCCSSI